MKHTLISLSIVFSLILTPLQGIHSATPTDTTALIQKLLEQIVILQAELNKLIAARGGNITSTTDTSSSCTFTRTLYIGTTGTDVTCLQTYLKKKGHLQGNATGYYGPITRDAVYKWQQSVGVVPEPKAIGMFGPRSQETLTREMRTAPSQTTNTTPTQTTTPKPSHPTPTKSDVPDVIDTYAPHGVIPYANPVTLKLNTEVPATCKYGTTDASYAQLPTTFSGGGTRTHTASLTNLSTDVRIKYYARCKTTQGVESDTQRIFFTVATKTPMEITPTPVVTPTTPTPAVPTPTTPVVSVPKVTTPTTTTPIATVPKGNATIPAPTTNSTSWNTLCAQSGIFVCDDFSDPTKLKGKLYTGTAMPVVQNGLLEFTIPTRSSANPGGQYTFTFPAIGEGKSLAFSYRIKADKVATELNAPGRKEFILWRGSSSCTDLELSQTHNGYGSPVIVPYTQCGAKTFKYSIPGTSNYQLNYPDYDCTYHGGMKSLAGCAYTHANEWENFYIELSIGNYGQPNSSVTMWKKIDGESAWKRYIATTTYAFSGSGGFDHFMLTVYMTGKDATVDHAEGKVYYDHLIMSTKPFNVDQFLSATGNSVASTPAPTTASVPASTSNTTPTTVATTTTSTTPSPSTANVLGTSALPKPTPAVSKTTSRSFVAQAGDIAPGYWANITADNGANDVDPSKDASANPLYPKQGSWGASTGYRSIWEAWNSGAFAPNYGRCGSIIYFGGGHVDYYGNEVVALDLCGGTANGPLWRRLSNPYTGPFTWPYQDGTFPNHTPSPPHTYDGLTFDESSNSLFLRDTQKNAANAANASFSWLFNLDTGQWSGPYTHKGSIEGTVAYDSKRKLVWFQPEQGRAGELTSFNTKTGAMTYYGWPYSYGLGNLDSMMGYDPLQDKLVLTSFRGGAMIAERDLSNPSTAWKVIAQKNTPAMHGQHAFAWSNLRQSWIVWDSYSGNSVYELKRGVNASGTPEYAWTLLTSPSNTVQAVGGSANGSFKKFQIVQTAPGVEVLIGQLRVADGIKAFRIPAPGASSRPTKVPLTSSQTKINLLQDLISQLKVLQAEVKKLKK